MPWNLEYHDDTQIIELTITGQVTGEDLQAAASARIALGKKKGVDRYVINARHIDAPRSTTPAVYDIPNRLYIEEGLSRSSSIAVIAPVDSESMWITGFYEDICVNRGWRVETFLDRDRAIDWLLNARP